MNDKDFAVIKINGHQYIVSEGDLITIDRLSIHSEITILLLNTGKDVMIGEPEVKDAGIELEVIEELKDKKIAVRRYKSKSRYRKNKGHRQPISVVKIVKFGKGVKTKITVNIVESKSESTDQIKESVKEPVEKKSSEKSSALTLDSVNITDSMRQKLKDAGYKNIEDIENASDEELTNIKGVGAKAVSKLREEIKSNS